MNFHLKTVRKEVRRRSLPLYNRLKALLSIWSLRTTILSIDTQSGAITDTTKLSDILLYGWNRLVLSVQSYHAVCRLDRSSPIEIEQHEVFVVSHNEIGIRKVAMNG
ncbi:hypothetical protein P692DRAFT_20866234 [Suillus brevipes Sb2]|nr:hypothetical protein P692DRAFT_20866234 [Suillus brevipes Sb2]